MKKIKDEYKGLVITFFAPGIGNVTFDPTKVKETEYDNFGRIGLDYIFEEDIQHICSDDCDEHAIEIVESSKKKGRKSMKSKMEEGEI